MADPETSSPSRIPTNPHTPAFWGLLVVLVGIGGFLLWAVLAPLSSGANAPGKLIVESKSKKVQHLEGGIVEALQVDSGDQVEAGEVLIRLNTTQEQAQVATARAKLDSALARRARLRAERRDADAPTFPQSLRERTDDQRVDQLLTNQRVVFQSRRAVLHGKQAVIDKRISGQKARREGLQEQVEEADAQIRFISEILSGEQSLEEEGYTARQKVLDLKRQRAQIQESRAKARKGIQQAEARIARLQRRQQQVRREYRKKVVERLQQLHDKIATFREQLATAQEKLERNKIRAPTGGEVVGLKVHTVGGVVPPRKTLMQIVPDKERLVIEARVRPADIDRVQTGQTAEVRFTSLSGRSTPVLLGTVKKVSADRLQQQGSDSQESYYAATVTVSRQELAKLGDQQLVAGMPVQVIIKAGSRTPLEYLLKPLTDSLAGAFLE